MHLLCAELLLNRDTDYRVSVNADRDGPGHREKTAEICIQDLQLSVTAADRQPLAKVVY